MELLRSFLTSALEQNLIDSVQFNADSTKCAIHSDTRVVDVVKGKKGYFISSGLVDGTEVFTNHPAAIVRLVANKLFGLATVDFKGNKYSGVSIYPNRVLSSGVEFKTANGKTFIVSSDETRVTLGLYDLLYTASGEHSILMMPTLYGSSPTIEKVAANIERMKPYFVSIRSQYLSPKCSTVCGDLIAVAANYQKHLKINEYLGDKSRPSSCVPTVAEALASSKSCNLKTVQSGYTLNFSVPGDTVKYHFSGDAKIDLASVQAAVSSAGEGMYSLASGVSVTDAPYLQLLSRGVQAFKADCSLVSECNFMIKEHDSVERTRIASSWLNRASSLRKANTCILEY